MEITPYMVAQRFVGLREVPGIASNPAILAMLRLDDGSVAGDDTPWCSAFVNAVAWLVGLPRSKSLAARSWLHVGTVIDLDDATPGFDVVILQRGVLPQPGSEKERASGPGHVGFYAGADTTPGLGRRVHLLGGNQGDAVSIAAFPAARVLGIRRLG